MGDMEGAVRPRSFRRPIRRSPVRPGGPSWWLGPITAAVVGATLIAGGVGGALTSHAASAPTAVDLAPAGRAPSPSTADPIGAGSTVVPADRPVIVERPAELRDTGTPEPASPTGGTGGTPAQPTGTADPTSAPPATTEPAPVGDAPATVPTTEPVAPSTGADTPAPAPTSSDGSGDGSSGSTTTTAPSDARDN